MAGIFMVSVVAGKVCFEWFPWLVEGGLVKGGTRVLFRLSKRGSPTEVIEVGSSKRGYLHLFVLFYGFRRGKERFFHGFRRWLSFYFGFRLLQDRGCLSDGSRKTTTRTFP